MKVCKICSLEKEETSFGRCRDTRSGKYYLRGTCKKCLSLKRDKDKLRERNRKARQKISSDPSKLLEYKEYHREYARKNRENIKKAKAKYRLENPEKIKLSQKKYLNNNPGKVKATMARYYSNNKEKVLLRTKEYYHQKIKALPVWANRNAINEIYKTAHELNREAGYIMYHVDHILPLRGKLVSGLHVPNNLRIVLASDNLAKSNKTNSIP